MDKDGHVWEGMMGQAQIAELEVTAGPASARLVSILTLTLDAPGWQSVPLGEMGSFVASDLGGLEGN